MSEDVKMIGLLIAALLAAVVVFAACGALLAAVMVWAGATVDLAITLAVIVILALLLKLL